MTQPPERFDRTKFESLKQNFKTISNWLRVFSFFIGIASLRGFLSFAVMKIAKEKGY